MKKIREIIRLKATTDMSERQIAMALKVVITVVARYLRDFSESGLSYEQITKMTDSELLKPLEKKKISKNQNTANWTMALKGCPILPLSLLL